MYEERHVSNTDRVGKRYRNMASVFTIGDEEEGRFNSAYWVILHDFLPNADIFFEIFFKRFLGILSEYQRVLVKIRPDILSSLIWVLIVFMN